MFVQIMQGRASDPAHLKRQLQRWRTELKPGAAGYLGSTSGVTADGRAIALVRFESEEAARANSDRPEQGAWWAETAKAFDGDVTFHDCHDVDVMMGGGSNEAGFVQVFQGHTSDQAKMRSLEGEMSELISSTRPDVLGALIAWHGDGGFTQAVYFQSEQSARRGEAQTEEARAASEFRSLITGEPTFWDLTEPDLD